MLTASRLAQHDSSFEPFADASVNGAGHDDIMSYSTNTTNDANNCAPVSV